MVPVVLYTGERDVQRQHPRKRRDGELPEASKAWRGGRRKRSVDGAAHVPKPGKGEGRMSRGERFAPLADCGSIARADAVDGKAPREEVRSETADVELADAYEHEGDGKRAEQPEPQLR